MRRTTVAVVVVVGLLALAACGNSENEGAGSAEEAGGGTPGVSDDEIRVGGVGSVTNPIGVEAGSAFDGAKAYLDIVNDDGGVDGRTIELVAEEDDSAQASRNASLVRSLVQQQDVFAVLPVATLSFSGARFLADEGVPTFGWNINTEWQGPENLFGEKGSYLCFDCGSPFIPYLAGQAGRSKTGIIAYTAAQSAACAAGQRASYERFGQQAGVELVFEDNSLGFGFTPGALDGDIQAMRDRGVQFLGTCIDGAGSGRLGEAIDRAGLDVIQYLPNGYDQDIVEEFGDVLEGSYVGSFAFPFEAEDPPEGMQQYKQDMEDAGAEVNELSLAGWISADLFVTGLRAVADAGDDLTRQSLVDAVNALDDYDAGGILPGTDWGIAHDQLGDEVCQAYLEIEGGEFVPAIGRPGEPFVCFDPENPNFDAPTIRG
jgi:branched-chain amino acid transport system substrate-binding protein